MEDETTTAIDGERLEPKGGLPGWVRLVLLAVIVGGLAAAAVLLPVKEYMGSFLGWVGDIGWWGPVVVVVVYIAACVLLLPGSVLTLGAGFLFGVGIGTVTVSIGSTLGATAAFFVARTVARSWIAGKVEGNVKFAAIDRAVGRQGFKIVFLTRLSPVFPFNVQNYAYGLTNVTWWHYTLASWIGMLPGTVMYVYFGSTLRSLADVLAGRYEGGPAQAVFFWGGLAVTVAVTVFVTRVARRALREAVGDVDGGDEVPEDAPTELSPEQNEQVELEPMDEWNRKLVDNVRPVGWTNPAPAERYNLVVIGAGTAGLVVAAGSAGLGAKVALVERNSLGGDCLNVGCVPSKCLIRSSRAYADIKAAGEYGVTVSGTVDVDFPAVMERMRRLRSHISHHDSVERFKGLGVDVFLGSAHFAGPDTVHVGDETLRFTRAVIATGARAVQPSLEGLDEAGYLTNENVFNLTERPRRLAVLGAGPIGCELAQAFSRLGCDVTLIQRSGRILKKEDSDLAGIVAEAMAADGIRLLFNTTVERVSIGPDGKLLHLNMPQGEETVTVDEILVGAGRAPNVTGLGLETVGVEYNTRDGVKVDDHLRTTNPRMYAAGDVCLTHKFTHTADAAARIVIRNALFWGRSRTSALTVPWCTFTDPEIAHVGLNREEADKRGVEVDAFERKFEEVDRAIADSEEEGIVRIYVKKGSDQILGATIVARHAGEMISEITTAMVGGVGLGTLSSVIHPYPTQAEAIRQTGDAYRRTKLTPFVKKLFNRILKWKR